MSPNRRWFLSSDSIMLQSVLLIATSGEIKFKKIIERLINKWEGVKRAGAGDRGGEIFKRQQLHDKFLD